MSCGFGLWGSSFSTNPAFAVDLSAASTPAIRSQARHIVSDQLSSKHPVPTPAVFDSSEASIAYGSRGVLHNIEVLSSFAEFGFDDPEKKCSHVKLLRDQLCNSLVVGDALKHNVVPLMATLVKDSGTDPPPVPAPQLPNTVLLLSSSALAIKCIHNYLFVSSFRCRRQRCRCCHFRFGTAGDCSNRPRSSCLRDGVPVSRALALALRWFRACRCHRCAARGER
jgi:hypothetical protein